MRVLFLIQGSAVNIAIRRPRCSDMRASRQAFQPHFAKFASGRHWRHLRPTRIIERGRIRATKLARDSSARNIPRLS